MSVKEALKQYVPPTGECHRARSSVTTPISMNPYFQIDQRVLWPESVLFSYGEKCRKALFVNGYHVLLCRRRVFVVRDQAVFSFPPFDYLVSDVYIENIDKENLLVVVGHEGGVHVGRVHCEMSSEVQDEFFVPTSSAVTKLHRLKKNLFCLCFSDCRVLSLVVQESQHGKLFADIQSNHQGWLAAAASLLLPARRRNYIDSFLDGPRSQLVVLSDCDVSLWTYEGGDTLRVVCSTPVPEASFTAVVPPSGRNGVGSLVLRSGSKVMLTLGSRPKDGAPALELGREEALPSGVAQLITVSAAREEANATVLYDAITCSLVLMGQENHASAEPIVASQVNLPEKLCGIAFVGRTDVRDSGTFWLYTHGPTVFRVDRISLGTRLQQQFARSRSEAVQFLSSLPATDQASLIMEAALDGLPLSDLDQAIEPLLRPVLRDSWTMALSPAAGGFVDFFMHLLDGLNQLCRAAPYWELSADLDDARKRTTRCYALLRTYLKRNGWLDYSSDITHKVQWVKLHAISQEPLTESAAAHAQACFLATLLHVVHHASTLAWLYALLLSAGIGSRFSKDTIAALWDVADPEEVESSYVMDLLACEKNEAETMRKLLAEEKLLPRKAQLSVRIIALTQADDTKGALQYASNHIQEIVHHDLFNYVADLLEQRAPQHLPRIQLLLQQYQMNPATSTSILSMLKSISLDAPDGADRLRRNLDCIFADEAAAELHSVVLDWMESHSLDDDRIEIFASIIAGLDMDVKLSNTLTGTFFACWSQEVRGNMPVAARNFGRLARTQLECPLSSRLVCVTHARRYDPDDEDKHTEFILLLQHQFVELLQEHMTSAGARGRLVAPIEQIRLDLAALNQHFLDESALFEVAGRYHELGGASIQLDILKIHSDAPEEVTAEALLAMLTFLKAAGRTGTEATQLVLREYLHNFEGVLPLNPFITFLAFDGVGPDSLSAVLLDCGVDARALFEAFLGLIDARGREPLFPVSDILQALTNMVDRVPAEQQNVCVSYLVECIRGMLAGEYRSLILTQSDVFSLNSMDAILERRLRHNR